MGGQLESVDLGVVPDVDRKSRVEEKVADRGGMGLGSAQLGKLFHHTLLGAAVSNHRSADRLNHDGGNDGSMVCPSDQGGPPHFAMGVEDRFTTIGIEDRIDGLDGFRLTTAEPESAFRIQVAEIPHPMPDAITVLDLGPGGGLRQMVIAAGDGRPGHENLSDLWGRQADSVVN